MDTEAAIRATMRDHPHDATPRLVLADFLDDSGRSEEAAMHRVIARPGDEESLREYARHTGGDSGEAFVATQRANHGYAALTPSRNTDTIVDYHAEQAANNTVYLPTKISSHERAAAGHRDIADDTLRLREQLGKNYPSYRDGGRDAERLADIRERHLHAAALHEAAAYHHRNKS